MTTRRLASLLPLTAVLAALAWAPSASAGPLVASAPSCDNQVLETPFTPWLDPSSYTLPTNGTFEAGAAGWTLSGASVVSGNEPYYVHAAGESQSLRLPAGASATSSTICVGLEHPTLRLFARGSGSLLPLMGAEVLFEDAAGAVHSLAIGTVAGNSSWQPTVPMAVVANLLPLLPGNYTPVAFRFTALAGDWRIDDVYVDPHHM